MKSNDLPSILLSQSNEIFRQFQEIKENKATPKAYTKIRIDLSRQYKTLNINTRHTKLVLTPF